MADNPKRSQVRPDPHPESAPRPLSIDCDLWVANVKDCAVEVYTKPTGPVESPRFECCRVFGPDDEVPVILDGREVGKVTVKDVLF